MSKDLVETKVNPAVDHTEGRRGHHLQVNYHPELLTFAQLYAEGINETKESR